MSYMFTRFLSSIDLFASKIQLTIFQKERKSSHLSQTLTMLVLLLTVIILKDELYAVFSQSHPQVLNAQQSQQEPPIFRLNPNNFTYAFKIFKNNQGQLQGVHGINKYFQYNLTYCHKTRTGDGKGPTNCTNIPLEECSLSKHFQTQAQYKYFQLYNFSSMMCINIDWWNQNELIIGGTVNSKDFYYLNLFASVCKNTTKSQTCSSQDIINSNLQGAFIISYISTSQVDHSLNGNPYLMNIKAKTTSISQIFQKTQRVTYSVSKTLTDVGYVTNQIQEQNSIIISDIEEFTDQISSNLVMFNQVVLLDDLLQVSIRQYDKLQTLIGSLGGLFSVLYQIIIVFGNPFILASLKLDLVNWISQNCKKDPINSLNDQTNCVKRKCERFKDILKIILGIKIERQNNLDLVKQLLDVNFIMEKILEIDKLKLILLDDEQLLQFNLLPLISENFKKNYFKHKQKSFEFSKVVFNDQVISPISGDKKKVFYQSPSDRDKSSFDELEEGKIQAIVSLKQKNGSGKINSLVKDQRGVERQLFQPYEVIDSPLGHLSVNSSIKQ